MTLEADLQRAYEKKALGGLKKAMRAVAIVVDASLKEMTPVKTGLAAGNWQASLNTPKDGVIPVGTNAGVGAVLGGLKPTDHIIFTNNVPYIWALERGHSQQAPFGMVRQSIQRGVNAVR